MTLAPPTESQKTATILIVDDDKHTRTLLTMAIQAMGYQGLKAENGIEALELMAEIPPDLILLDVNMPAMNGIEFIKRIRSHPLTQSIPVIFLTANTAKEDMIEGLGLGADDYLTKPFDLEVLKALVEARLSRHSTVNQLATNPHRADMTYPWAIFEREIERELARQRSRSRRGFVACIELHEFERLLEQLGNIQDAIGKQIQAQVMLDGHPLEILSINDDARFYLLMPDVTLKQAQNRLRKLSGRISTFEFRLKTESLNFTPVIGFTPLVATLKAEQICTNLHYALDDARNHLDLDPKLYDVPKSSILLRVMSFLIQFYAPVQRLGFLSGRGRTLFQISLTFILGIGVPFLAYLIMGRVGADVTPFVYIFVVIALLLQATLIWIEGFAALRKEKTKPDVKAFPLATAIIPAYLPNEAGVIMDTIDAFLQLTYPGPIQVILAYNTPIDMPIEQEFEQLAKKDPRFQPLRVPHSTSKAQNVNAALDHVVGEFVGIFDADHQPISGAFRTAWQWLEQGYDVVQGHCVIRNGDESWVSRMIAVEFEAIYAVAHPGRARMHGFGIFGGSNGYWKTDLLRQTRLHGFMLTEDIDSSMRLMQKGYKIKVDPQIISRELAPVTLKALWNQRLRWAQGWFQVSKKYLFDLLGSQETSPRQKFGIWQLIAWREVYPWVSMQIIPIVLYWAVQRGGFQNVDWFIPIFVVTSIVTLGTGPAQILFIRKLGHPSITSRKKWLLFYFVATFVYVEYKNTIARVAQMKELMREHGWTTTPRG